MPLGFYVVVFVGRMFLTVGFSRFKWFLKILECFECFCRMFVWFGTWFSMLFRTVLIVVFVPPTNCTGSCSGTIFFSEHMSIGSLGDLLAPSLGLPAHL